MAPSITGSISTKIQLGKTTQAEINLQTGPIIAKMFLIHFARDSAFIEPPMRLVLEQVVNYAENHPDEKLLIVGHTDLTGSAEYNQSLSERRARSAYAFLTYGHSPEAAVAEWNTLRMKRPRGELPSIKDSWGVCEYQFMLQDLGYYAGNIDSIHGTVTGQAISSFQSTQENIYPELSVTGTVDKDTWEALIERYIAQDAFVIPKKQFIPQRWIGCGEQDPVKNTQDAWRPNRRTEFLFVRAPQLPCKLAPPDTLHEEEIKPYLWGGEKRCGFTTRNAESIVPDSKQWLIQLAAPGQVRVQGKLTLEDDITPVAHTKFALIASDGEYLHTNAYGESDLGENPSGRKRGKPIWNKTNVDGCFSFPHQKPAGIYTLELPDLKKYGARAVAKIFNPARGNIVFQELSSVSFSSPQEEDYKPVSTICEATIKVKVIPQPDPPNITIKGRLFWIRAWDRSGYNLPPGRNIKEFLPGAKVELELESINEKMLNQEITNKESFLQNSEPLGSFEFKQVPQNFKAKLRIYLEHQNNVVVLEKGSKAMKNKALGKFDIISHEVVLGNTRQSGNKPECDYGEIQIKVGDFIGACDTYKSIWFAQDRLLKLTGLNGNIPCKIKYLAKEDSFNPYKSYIKVSEKSIKIRDRVLHEYAHFVVREYLDWDWTTWFEGYNQEKLYGYVDLRDESEDVRTVKHTTESKEHYETSWLESLANFLNGVIQNTPKLEGYGVDLEKYPPTVIGPHSEGSIQEALWHIYKELEETVSFKESFWKILSCKPKLNRNIFDFLNNWRHLKIQGFNTVIEAFERSNLSDGYRYSNLSSPASSFICIAPPSGERNSFAYICAKRFWSVHSLAEYFGRSDSVDGRSEYKEEFFNRNKFFNATSLKPRSKPSDPQVAEGKAYMVPQHFNVAHISLVHYLSVFGDEIHYVKIEGILNSNRDSFSIEKLHALQKKSLFRIRADLPDVEESTVQAELTPLLSSSQNFDALPEKNIVDLERYGQSFTFISEPILAIPWSIKSTDITLVLPKELEIIRCSSGGFINVKLLNGLERYRVRNVQVRGRSVYLFVRNFIGSGASIDGMKEQVNIAQEVWSQAGIEIKLRSIEQAESSPNLLDLNTDTANLKLSEDELILLGIKASPNSPLRSSNSIDVNIYSIRSFRDSSTGTNLSLNGIAYSRAKFTEIPTSERAVIAIKGHGSESKLWALLAHELGHIILSGSVSTHYNPATGGLWPPDNVMSPANTHLSLSNPGHIKNINLDVQQLGNILVNEERYVEDRYPNPNIYFE
jgi:hypothetical protein